MIHVPVLLHEVIALLDVHPGNMVIDGTLGGGGHALAILEKMNGKGCFIGIDRDREAIRNFKETLSHIHFSLPRIVLTHGDFSRVQEILQKEKVGTADKVLIDCGLSSDQLETSRRGFSFLKNEPLDMRYDVVSDSLTAAEVVNSFPEKKIADILWQYGEERHSRKITEAIMRERKKKRIISSEDLVHIIERAGILRRGKIHPATKTFLALRIFVNHEYDSLKKFLDSVCNITQPKSNVAIISFNSSEDRIVKQSFRELVLQEKGRLMTKKPISPSDQELHENPRSRSAKLRVIQII